MTVLPDQKNLQLVISAIALTFGCLIYVLWRPEHLLMFDWFTTIGADPAISYFRDSLSHLSRALPNWFLYSLPNGLWMFSYTLLLLCLWGGVSQSSVIWISILLLASLASEFLQAFALLPGTFDEIDLLSYLGGVALAALYFYLVQEERP